MNAATILPWLLGVGAAAGRRGDAAHGRRRLRPHAWAGPAGDRHRLPAGDRSSTRKFASRRGTSGGRCCDWRSYWATIPNCRRPMPRRCCSSPSLGVVGAASFGAPACLRQPGRSAAGSVGGFGRSFPAAAQDPPLPGGVLFRQIPDTISLVLRAVRAGLPVSEALRNCAGGSFALARRFAQSPARQRSVFRWRRRCGICSPHAIARIRLFSP